MKSAIPLYFVSAIVLFFSPKVSSQAQCIYTYTNMDIFQHDLSNAAGNSSQCCGLCQETAGCVAVVYEDNVCYFKSATQPLIANSGRTTTIMSPSANATYSLKINQGASNFFNNSNFAWHFVTWGLTNVTDNVGLSTAESLGMIKTIGNQVYIGVQNSTVYTTGRPSVQFMSNYLFNSGLFVLSAAHIPTGVGTWPSWWFQGPSWPTYGEIDVLEGVNGMTSNLMTIHTGNDCLMYHNSSEYFTGNWGNSAPTLNCYQYASSNSTEAQGCSVSAPNVTFGPAFNAAGGGVFAMQWSVNGYIRIWNFINPNIPADIANGSSNPNPDTWGLPAAQFTLGSSCPLTAFQNQSMTFDTALCGSWAAQYVSGGEASCENTLLNNPSAYNQAYWLINYAKVFCTPHEPCGFPISSCQFAC